MVTVLRSRGILKTIRKASEKRPAIYAFEELIEITERQACGSPLRGKYFCGSKN